FADTERTLLVGDVAWPPRAGNCASEPVYLPADAHCPFHRIVYAHGFFASALHEVAHWCMAGKQRRLRVDYGYWYEPDQRDADQQAQFERVEAKPQALEWAFSIAAGFPFRVSVDNLSGIPVDRDAFRARVLTRLRHCAARRFPPRARRVAEPLMHHYGTRFEMPRD